MCKYCESKEDISDRIFSDRSKYSDSICRVRIYEDPFYGISLGVRPVKYDNGEKLNYIEHVFPIKFCPMCGKRLNIKKEE